MIYRSFVLPFAAALAACASSRPVTQAPAPTPRAPVDAAVVRGSTEAGITAADLRARLSVYAADSMLGREAGTLGNVRATDYLAAELRRLGVEPAGENGGYFQPIPLRARTLDTTATLAVGGDTLTLWTDYVPLPAFEGELEVGMAGSLDGAVAVFGGSVGDTSAWLTPEQVRGRLVVLGPPRLPLNPFTALSEVMARYHEAKGIAVSLLDLFPQQALGFLKRPTDGLGPLPEGPLGLLVGGRAATALLGTSVPEAQLGQAGATVRGSFRFTTQDTPYPARNVVGIVRGSDPALRGEYVAIGAHNDHIGTGRPQEHDSLRAYNRVVRPMGADSPNHRPSAEEQARIRTLLDSLRLTRPPRTDSVFNGADDDGSGTVTVLELAEAAARAATKPRRSLLFIWHTGEEKGLYGSKYFTEHPTVPRDSIVTQLNMDMVGRGDEGDIAGGGPGYLQLIGSRRLSTELGDLVEAVNTRGGHGFTFDYQFDADGHPENYYCRSDHYMYARFGIPITFFSTGSHTDYHQLTDEMQYIDFAKMARVASFVYDVAVTVANLDHAPVVDKPKPDPYGNCQQ